jgi:hypothetical protein
VGKGHRRAYLGDNVEGATDLKGSINPDPSLEILAFHIFHHNVLRVAILAHIVHGHDVWVWELGYSARFTLKGVTGVVFRTQYFDRHGAFQGQIICPVDKRHSSSAL